MENNFATMSEVDVTRHPVDASKSSLKVFGKSTRSNAEKNFGG